VDSAQSRDPNDLPKVSGILQFPLTLLSWYRNMLQTMDITFTPEDRQQIGDFIDILVARSNALQVRQRSLPEFHFDILQPTPLHQDQVTTAASVSIRFRCQLGELGTITRFDIQRLLTDIRKCESTVWSARISLALRYLAKKINETVQWKAQFGILKPKTLSIIDHLKGANTSNLLDVFRPDSMREYEKHPMWGWHAGRRLYCMSL